MEANLKYKMIFIEFENFNRYLIVIGLMITFIYINFLNIILNIHDKNICT